MTAERVAAWKDATLAREPAAPRPTPNGKHANAHPIHPALLQPCKHGDGEEEHQHAIDLLQFASAKPPAKSRYSPPTTVPSSVPNPVSSLTASRPSLAANGAAAATTSSSVKVRRMSSSTQGALARGKLGLTGDSGNVKESRPISSSVTAPVAPGFARHASASARAGTSPTPQLFDFSKTDRQRAGRSISSAAVPASVPNRGMYRNAIMSPQTDDMELEMEFDPLDDDDEGEISGRSGSADAEGDGDVDMDGEDGLAALALGTGSGGVKGRRKGKVFKCHDCGKEYKHPICLTKHRWEHTPYWKEPTQLSMSKHQQVQALEGAAILMHMNPVAAPGRSLPADKSLWPAILSPNGESLPLRRASRDHSAARSPPSSVLLPLTPSSLREPSSFGALSDLRPQKERKSSPGSDTTTSSMGASEPVVPQPRQSSGGALGLNAISPVPVGIVKARSPSYASPPPGPIGIAAHSPQSVGSLPGAMATLNFRHNSFSSTPGHVAHRPTSYSPIPDRGVPLSLGARAGLIGGGMFSVRENQKTSSVRSGVARAGSDERDDEDGGVDYGMAGEMEL